MKNKSKVIEIARAISMLYAVRHVYIRGYTRTVKVLDAQPNKNDEYRCQPINGGSIELVPSHHFYHDAPGGLVLRDSLEFKRKYGDHHIGIVCTPDYLVGSPKKMWDDVYNACEKIDPKRTRI